MKQVKEHIAAIAPAWLAFKSTNQGFELVNFSVYTGEDGIFRVCGCVTSDVQVINLLKFLGETHPPTPIYTNQLCVVTPDSFQTRLEDQFESDGSATGNATLSSATNSRLKASESGH